MRRRLLVLIVIALVGVPMPIARACSCGGENPRDALVRTDGAFIGVVLAGAEVPRPDARTASSGDPYEWTLRVEEAFKGRLGDRVVVRSGMPSGGTCGLSLDVGERTALFVDKVDGHLWGSVCQQVEPAVMREAAQPLPSPDGTGPAAFLAGTRGEYRVVTLDRAGRVLRYGKGKDGVSFDVCPGGRWAAEVNEVFGFVNGRPYMALGRREIDTLRFVEPRRLVPFELREPDEPFGVAAISCRDATATDVYVFGTHAGARDDDLLLRVQDGKIARVLGDQIGGIAFSRTRPVVYIATGDRHDRLVEVDLESLDRREIARLPGPAQHLALDASGDRLAGAALVEHPKAELFTLDLDDGTMHTSRRPRGVPVWVGERVAVPHHTGNGLHIYDARMRLIASKPKWKGGATAVGNRLFGAWSGDVYYTDPEEGPILPLSETRLSLAPLAEVRSSAPAQARQPRLTWTGIGLAAFVLAFIAVVVRSRSTKRREPRDGSEAFTG
jgi:hypothetical protein